VHNLGSVRTIQLITSDEYCFRKGETTMTMIGAVLFNGSQYIVSLGLLAMAWGWLHRSDS
jgi:hypothetical protein